MGLTLSELLKDKTKEDFRDQALLALQGIQHIEKTGFGSGSLEASGAALAQRSIRLKVVTAGGLGTAVFQYSLDGGSTYSANVTIPSGGTYVLPSTGVTLQFLSGPATATGNSFEVGDVFALEASTPTFGATSWQPGSTPLTLVEVDSDTNADAWATFRKVIAGGFLGSATDDWLDLGVQELYGDKRIQGSVTIGTVNLTDAFGSGPHVIAPGDVWVATASGYRYSATTGGTLPKNGSLSISVQAEKPGTAYNVGQGSINVLLTALPGVTVSNSSTTWITQQGRNRETDGELVARMRLKWPSIGVGSVNASYEKWAKETPTYGQGVTRTRVSASTTTPGQVNVLIAGSTGPLDATTVAKVNEYIAPRVPTCGIAVVTSATAAPVTITGTLFVKMGFGVSATTVAQSNLAALFGGGLNNKGEELPGIAIGGIVYLSQVIEQVMLVDGARNTSDLRLNGGLVDIELTAVQVATLANSITVTEVA